jgi:hypothetical protein
MIDIFDKHLDSKATGMELQKLKFWFFVGICVNRIQHEKSRVYCIHQQQGSLDLTPHENHINNGNAFCIFSKFLFLLVFIYMTNTALVSKKSLGRLKRLGPI